MTKYETKVIKGVAIVLMLMYHLWSFSERLNGSLTYSFNIFKESSIKFIGDFGQICVSIFFFLAGYGIYIQSTKKINLFEKIKKLYLTYWKVFIIFVPLSFLLYKSGCTNAYTCRFEHFSFKEAIDNFLMISTSYNGEWWFLKSFVIVTITFPLIKKIIEKYDLITNIVILILLSIMFSNIFPILGTKFDLNNNFIYTSLFCQTKYVVSYYMGVIFAKYLLFDKLKENYKKNKLDNLIIDFVIIGILIYLRNIAIGDDLDFIYVPIFIVASINIINKLSLDNLFFKLGIQSTNMWLTHTYFIYYLYPINKYILYFKNPIIVLIVLIIVSYVTSLVINKIFYKETKKISNISKLETLLSI